MVIRNTQRQFFLNDCRPMFEKPERPQVVHFQNFTPRSWDITIIIARSIFLVAILSVLTEGPIPYYQSSFQGLEKFPLPARARSKDGSAARRSCLTVVGFEVLCAPGSLAT